MIKNIHTKGEPLIVTEHIGVLVIRRGRLVIARKKNVRAGTDISNLLRNVSPGVYTINGTEEFTIQGISPTNWRIGEPFSFSEDVKAVTFQGPDKVFLRDLKADEDISSRMPKEAGQYKITVVAENKHSYSIRITEPDTQEPDTQEPDTQEPDTQEPDTQEPDTQEPDTQEPDTQSPTVITRRNVVKVPTGTKRITPDADTIYEPEDPKVLFETDRGFFYNSKDAKNVTLQNFRTKYIGNKKDSGVFLQGTHEDNVFVNCSFENFFVNMYFLGIRQPHILKGGYGRNVQVLNCDILRARGSAHGSQGILAEFIDGLVVDNCNFEENGAETHSIFNHEIYAQFSTQNLVVKNSRFKGASATAIMARGGGQILNNYITRCPLGIITGLGRTLIKGNEISHPIGYDDAQRDWGITVHPSLGTIVEDNYIHSGRGVLHHGAPYAIAAVAEKPDSGYPGHREIIEKLMGEKVQPTVIRNNRVENWPSDPNHGPTVRITKGHEEAVIEEPIQIDNKPLVIRLHGKGGAGSRPDVIMHDDQGHTLTAQLSNNPNFVELWCNDPNDNWWYGDKDNPWLEKLVIQLVKRIRGNCKTFMHGISMGGGGAIRIALRAPDTFDAVRADVPALLHSNHDDHGGVKGVDRIGNVSPNTLQDIKDTPEAFKKVYLLWAEDDTSVSPESISELRKTFKEAGVTVIESKHLEGGHKISDEVFDQLWKEELKCAL